MNRFWMTLSATALVAMAVPACAQQVQYYDVPPGGRAHDVAVTADGKEVWWTVQRGGGHGILNPVTGETTIVPLGEGTASSSVPTVTPGSRTAARTPSSGWIGTRMRSGSGPCPPTPARSI